MSEPQDLGQGVWCFTAPLWQTNALLAVSGRDALLCDPAMTPEEIRAIRAAAAQGADGRSYLLITHADYDHVCGIPYFPGAEVVAGSRHRWEGRGRERRRRPGERRGGVGIGVAL